MKKIALFLIIAFFDFAALICVPSFAADEVSEQAKSDLSSQAETFREKSALPAPQEEVEAKIVPAEMKELPAAPESSVRFVLKKIVLEGNTVFSEQDLNPIYSSSLEHEVAVSDLKEIADAITSYYRSRGFLLSKAYLLAQKIEEGVVTIKIVEGKIREIKIEGNKYFANRVYKSEIRLRADRVFRYGDLENNLVYLGQKPDRSATAYLSPTDEPELFDLVLKAEETKPFHLYYMFNNSGTKLTHRARHYVQMENNNFTGEGDVMSSTLSLAEDGALAAGAAAYSYPIEAKDVEVSLTASYVRTQLVGDLKRSEIEGISWSVSPGITRNFYRSVEKSLEVFVGLDVKDSKTTVRGARLEYDRVRILKAGPRFMTKDAHGRSVYSAHIHQGIPGLLGGLDSIDPNAGVPNAGGEFTYYTLEASRVQELPFSSFLSVQGDAQWTDDNLVSSEKFRAGGASSVRGYPESDSSGDAGFFLSGEINMPTFLPRTAVPFCNRTWYDSTRWVAFVDSAGTYLRNKASESVSKSRMLVGAGVGVRFDVAKNFSMRIDLGFPVGDNPADESSYQIHFALRAGF